MANTSDESWNVELCILSPTVSNVSGDVFITEENLATLTCNGRYFDCLKKCCNRIPYLNLQSADDIYDLSDRISEYLLKCGEEERYERELDVLCSAISCLQLFVLSNWTGPSKVDVKLLFPSLDILTWNDEILSLLEVDGETLYPLVEVPLLMYIAKTSLQNTQLFRTCKTAAWWHLRYISVHQQLLTERAPSLHDQAKSAFEVILKEDFLKAEEHRSYSIQLHLEAGLIQLFYYQYKDAEKHFEIAESLAGVQCRLDGALGVRTQFQTKALAQLKVKITKTRPEVLQTKSPNICEKDLPKALPLNDDVLLETVKFTEETEDHIPDLTAEEHAIILMTCTNMQKTSPSHKLRDEELLCILEFLLSDPKAWAVHVEALRARSALQRFKSRTVERSMMQLETLVKSIVPKKSHDFDEDTAIKRLSLFYSVWPKPKWTLEKQLAQLFESLGALSSALDIYKRLHMWEEAIVCLIRTGRGREAEVMIREQLSIKETANLYCLLGDVLQDPAQYEKAWELSKNTSARAMRSLAAYKVSKKQYKEAIVCFEKSLGINYLQVGAWFSMGCAALAREEYEKAAKSFQKCVNLNWDNFEAWGNLSTSFVRCNKKKEAYRALQEAIKCDFNIWQLWENFLLISTDVGQFNDVIRAYNRLLDIKDKYLDIPVLKILVRAITEDVLDGNEQPASKFKQKALELFGRLTSKTTSNWEVWSLYALLLGNGMLENSADVNDKALNYMQKALRSGLQQASWEKDEKSAGRMVDLAMNLIDACLHCHKQNNMSKDQRKSVLTSTKLSMNSVVAKLKFQTKQLLSEDSKQPFEELARKLEEKLSHLNLLLQEDI